MPTLLIQSVSKLSPFRHTYVNQNEKRQTTRYLNLKRLVESYYLFTLVIKQFIPYKYLRYINVLEKLRVIKAIA